LLVIVLCCLYTTVSTQTSNPTVDFSDGNDMKSDRSLNAVQEGNIIIEPWYGGPLFGKALYNSIPDSSSWTNFSYTGIGPFGGSVEYMLADNVGLGIDFIINRHSWNYSDASVDAMGNQVVYDYKFQMERQRIHLRFNYHFSQDDNVDAYFGVGVGTNARTLSFKTNQPGYQSDETEGQLLPVSMRICVGTRYYFTKNIGIVAEAGIGGALVRAGLSIKI
jgi:hypothetical protein